MFTIDSENNIVAHAALPAGADASQSFSTAKELAKLTAEWPASRMVDTRNSFAGVAPFDDLKPVKKFTNRWQTWRPPRGKRKRLRQRLPGAPGRKRAPTNRATTRKLR